MKLSDLYPTLSTDERELLAQKAGTQAGYIWQLATQWRGKRPSIDLIGKLAAADDRLSLAELVEEFMTPRDGQWDESRPRSAANHPGERAADKKARA